MIKFKCFNCESRIMARDRAAGTRIKCPNCGTRVIVPEAKPKSDSSSTRSSRRPKRSSDQTTIMGSLGSGSGSTRNPVRSSNESANAIDRNYSERRKKQAEKKKSRSSKIEGLPTAEAKQGDTAEWRKKSSADPSSLPLSMGKSSEDSDQLDLSEISEDTLLPLDVGEVDKKLLGNLEELFESGILKEAEYIQMRDKILKRD